MEGRGKHWLRALQNRQKLTFRQRRRHVMPHNTNLIDIRSAHWHKLVIPSATAASRAHVVLFFYYTDGDRTGAIGASSDWGLFFSFSLLPLHMSWFAQKRTALRASPQVSNAVSSTRKVSRRRRSPTLSSIVNSARQGCPSLPRRWRESAIGQGKSSIALKNLSKRWFSSAIETWASGSCPVEVLLHPSLLEQCNAMAKAGFSMHKAPPSR